VTLYAVTPPSHRPNNGKPRESLFVSELRPELKRLGLKGKTVEEEPGW
jgi:hypothetical protein